LIWFLRHISVRLWITALLCMPASLYIVFKLSSIAPDTNPITLILSMVLFIFIILGLILDFLGKKIISRLIKEGDVWERAGIHQRSEEKFYKALRVYDSFLISPLSARGCAQKLSGAMARFMAVSKNNDASFEKASTLFLKLSPGDEHMALLWLRRLFNTVDLDFNTIDHDVLTLIAENHYQNQKILPSLTNIFIQLKRTDFTAQKVYKQALTYLKKNSTKRTEIQKLLRENEDSDTMPSKLTFADSSPLKKPASNRKFKISNFLEKTGNYIHVIINQTRSSLNKFSNLLIKHKNIKTYIQLSLIIICLLLVTSLLFSTFSNYLKPDIQKKDAPGQVTITAAVPDMPYTIQIAAFLSQSHAEKYTTTLKKTGLDARFVKVDGKNKAWYLVRISKFNDKASAAAYGQKLKGEGLIKDFFVANK